MDNLNFKIKRIGRIIPPKIQFVSNDDPGVIYEGLTAYMPNYVIQYNGDKKLDYYAVYFWSGYDSPDKTPYWRFINKCSLKDFEEIIKPRIDGKIENI